MALLFIQHNLYYSVEVLYEDGRCFNRIFTGAPQKAREAALTYFLENLLDDAACEESFLVVSLHHLKSGEKVTVTSTALLREPHDGLQEGLALWEREGIKTDRVCYSYHKPQAITLLPVASQTPFIRNEHTIMGIAADWVVTFGRKKQMVSRAV